ncbi:MAG: hypothetical protein U0105_22940 [Candidatus Obscuribacterales bacterium]
MKRTTLLASLALIALAATSLPAEARWIWGGDGINGTQVQLQNQINAGVASGRLTKSEAQQMQSRMNEITAIEAQYRRSGGKLSPKERGALEAKLDRLQNAITRQISDADTRWNRNHRRGKGYYKHH